MERKDGRIGSKWKRIAAWSLAAVSCAWLVASPAAAAGQHSPRRNLERGMIVDLANVDAVLYEVTEKMYLLDAKGNVVMSPELAVTRKADASLFGWARLGSLLCPAKQLLTNPGLSICSVTADGIDNISLWTGKGAVDGTFAVVVQDDNKTDAPEYVVMNGTFAGSMDLSIRPLGKVVGTFTASGGQPVPFCGTFRLPFALDRYGNRVDPTRWSTAYYLGDDGVDLMTVRDREKSLGMPTVRLEINLGAKCSQP
jgi:hypothetical protein